MENTMEKGLLQEETLRTIQSEGFVLAGFVGKRDANFRNWIGDWLQKGYHADMHWLERNRATREAPCTIESYGESIIAMAYPYRTQTPDIWKGGNPISNYAWGEDYHKVLKRKLQIILRKMSSRNPKFQGRGFVDSAPIPEKIVAVAGGLGWIGKNSMLLNRYWGSYLFLAEIVCNIPFRSTTAARNYCGSCTKCVDACPTGAIVGNAVIDSNRCISYLTIEKKGAFTVAEKSSIQYQLFGCDICQQVCPWNRKQRAIPNSPFECFDRWLHLDLKRIDRLSESEFDALKQKSPIKRITLKELQRNADAVAEQNGPDGFD